MRTRTEMLAQARKWLRDIGSQEWTDAEILVELESAAAMLAELLVMDPLGKPLLRTRSAVRPVALYLLDYPVPADARLIEAVYVRDLTTRYATLTCAAAGSTVPAAWAAIDDGEFVILTDAGRRRVSGVDFTGDASMDEVAATLQAALRSASGGTETVTWDSDALAFVFKAYNEIGYLESLGGDGTDLSAAGWCNGGIGAGAITIDDAAGAWEELVYDTDGSGVYACPRSGLQAMYGRGTGRPSAWCEATEAGYVRLWPKLITVSAVYQLQYIREPAFPASASAAFAGVPNGYDALVEFLAVALLSHEELEDGKPMGYFGSLFRQRYDLYVRGRGAIVRPSRRYIQRES